MSAAMDRLTDEVAENKSTIESAKTLLSSLSALIIAGKDDPFKMQALADELDRNSNALAAAVVANTPAADAPPATEGASSKKK